jgi:DNA-binding LacI/PurR family transcriptional regulator
MKKGIVTIKDIAQKLDISVATVSKALRGLKGVKPETSEAVIRLAKKWNYHPNAVALSLMNNRTNNIGVIIPGLIIPFYASAISGIQEVASQHGFNILVCQSNESYKTEITNTQAFISSRVDGIIISISRETKSYEHLRQLQKRGIPLVFFNRVCHELDTPRVIVDDYEGAFKATEYLISVGKRKIAHIGGPENLSLSRNRLTGYLDALSKHNIPVNKKYILESDLTTASGAQVMGKLLKLADLPDAVFAVCDAAAYGAMQSIQAQALRIPEDISVVGFTNEPNASIVDPPLTTISQPTHEIGRTAARILIDLIQNKDAHPSPDTVVLKTSLVKRKSA